MQLSERLSKQQMNETIIKIPSGYSYGTPKLTCTCYAYGILSTDANFWLYLLVGFLLLSAVMYSIVLISLLKFLLKDRVVTKISSSRVKTTSRRGIKQLGISFGSIFLLFSNKSSRGPLSQQPGKIPGPRLLMTTLE